MFCLFPSNLHRNSENFKPNQVAKKTLWWERNMWLGGFLKENRSFLLLNVVLLYGNPAESISKPRKAAKEGFNLFSVSFDSTVEIQQTSHNWWRSNALFGHLKQQMLNDHCLYAVASQIHHALSTFTAIPPALSCTSTATTTIRRNTAPWRMAYKAEVLHAFLQKLLPHGIIVNWWTMVIRKQEKLLQW